MLANYGYEDGSGAYYIKLDTASCAECTEKTCLTGCPAGLFQIELDDFDDEVVTIPAALRNTLAGACAACKGGTDRPACLALCPHGAISHTW